MEEDTGRPNTGTSAITLSVNHVSTDKNCSKSAMHCWRETHRKGTAGRKLMNEKHTLSKQ